MAAGQEFAGFQQYLFLAPETVWGQTPGSPTYLYLPYATYDVQAKPQAVQPQLFTGLYERRESRVLRTLLDGPLNVPLFGYQVANQSIAQYLINWALTRVTPVYLSSYLAELSENGVDNKRHNGLRVNQLTLAGDSDGGVIQAQLQLMGALETGGITTQTVPTNTPQPVEFLFADATLTVGGSLLPIRSFSLTVKNNLQTKFTNNQWPTLVHAGVREVDFTFTLFKNANTYDLLARLTGSNNTTMTLFMKGLHLGTGPVSTTYSTVQIDFARASFASLANNRQNLNDLVQQAPGYVVLKPDTAADEMVMTYGAV
jgi:hypothetical protein